MVAVQVMANDLARVTVGVTTDTTSGITNNYLGLTGKNVLVEVKAAAPQPVAAAPSAAPVDQTAMVLGAINTYSSAFNAHDVGKMQALWTGMSSGQAKGLAGFFKDNPTAKVVENCPANQLNVGGDSADANCTETTSFMASGKMISTPHAAHFHLARKGSVWTITDKR